MHRREFAQAALGSLVTASLVEMLLQCGALAADAKVPVGKWLIDVDALGRDLKGQKLSQTDWQKKIESLYAQVEMDDLLKAIDFEKLASGAKLVDNGALSLRVQYPSIEGLPQT